MHVFHKQCVCHHKLHNLFGYFNNCLLLSLNKHHIEDDIFDICELFESKHINITLTGKLQDFYFFEETQLRIACMLVP